MRTWWSLPALLGLALAIAQSLAVGAAVASPRAALVIGNAAYPDADDVLKTPIGDADIIAETLARNNFAVEIVKNGTRRQTDAVMARFLDGIGPGSDIAVFFAGYGIQVGRRNYLIPVDARIWNEADVLRDGIAVDSLLADAARKGANARIVMLDASRRNPFERRFRGLSAGLAAATPRPGVLTMFSAAAGAVLADADGPTSLFADELRRQMVVPTVSAEQAFAACRENISRVSHGQEVPAVVSGLETPFYFDPARKPPEPKVATKPSPPLSASLEPQMSPSTAAPTTAKQGVDPDIKAQAAKPEPLIVEPLPTPAVKASRNEPSGSATPLQSQPPATELKPSMADPSVALVEPQTEAVPHSATVPAVSLPQPVPGPGSAWKPLAVTPYDAEELARRAALNAIIARNPRDVEAMAERGRILAQHGELAPAIADFDRVLKIDPRNVEALNNRCWARAVRNQLQPAVADCNEALRLRHDYADAYDTRGLIYLKTGQARAALADYEAAIKIDPSHSSAIYGRGLAHYRLGDKEMAARDFTTALGLNGTIDRQYAQYGVQ